MKHNTRTMKHNTRTMKHNTRTIKHNTRTMKHNTRIMKAHYKNSDTVTRTINSKCHRTIKNTEYTTAKTVHYR
jgi:hypothetical protein